MLIGCVLCLQSDGVTDARLKGAATPDTILGTWATTYGTPALVTSKGFGCVSSTYMYLNKLHGDVGSYTMWWRDIAPGVATPEARRLMLGGEVSMWTDDYCYSAQCGAKAGPTPAAAQLYGPDQDARFARSIAGVRGFWARINRILTASSWIRVGMHRHRVLHRCCLVLSAL